MADLRPIDPFSRTSNVPPGQPSLTPLRWQKIKELFALALDLESSERAAFLQQTCGEDELLRAEVESLLESSESDGAATSEVFKAVSLPATELSTEAKDLMLARLVGNYRIDRRIGFGGMAAVYLASRADEQYQKQVAIKILRPELDNAELLKRFRNERQTLAVLEHPNIVRLLDGGSTEEGLPYLVMDYVDGEPIDEYCNTHKLPTEERLRLFCNVCASVRFAHQNFIIHRDLKPSNILVTADGTPKLLDFGIAKVLDADTNQTIITETVTRRLTPAYASPEQLRGQTVTAATDIYSLGVVLYELLSGHRPYKLKQHTPAELELAICQETPEKPSTAVDRIETGTAADGTTVTKTPESVSQTREGEPNKLRRRLHGDLDNIVLMALHKEPNRRYLSVQELSDDIRRHLNHLPVKAQRSTLAYRVSKLLERHKTEVIAVAAILLIMLAALGIIVWQQRRATQTARPEVINRQASGRPSVAVLGFKNLSGRNDTAWLSTALSEMLTTELAAGGKLRTISGEDITRMKLDLSLPNEDALASSTLRKVHQYLNSDFVVLGSYAEFGSDGRQIRFDLRLQDASGEETISASAESGTENDLATLVARAGTNLREKMGAGGVSDRENAGTKALFPSNSQAAKFYAEGLEKQRAFEPQEARHLLEEAVVADPRYALAHSALAESWFNLGNEPNYREETKKAFGLAASLPREQQLLVEGRYRQAVGEWEKAIEIYRTLFSFFPDNLDYGLRLASVQISAGKAKDSLGTVELLRKLPLPAGDDPRIDMTQVGAAAALSDYKQQANLAKQASIKGERIGARLLVALARLAEGRALTDLGDAVNADVALKSAKQLFADLGYRYGEARASHNMGVAFSHEGRLDDARQAYEEALKIFRELGNRDGEAGIWNDLGNILNRENQVSQSKHAYEQSLTIYRDLKDAQGIGLAVGNIAMAEASMGDNVHAKAHFQEAITLDRATGDKSALAGDLTNVAVVMQAEADFKGARRALQEAADISRETGRKIDLGFALLSLGDLDTTQGQLATADKIYSAAQKMFIEGGDQARAAIALSRSAQTAFWQDDLANALEQQEKALTALTNLHEGDSVPASRIALARISFEQGHFTQAETDARQASKEFEDGNNTNDEAQAEVLIIRSLVAQTKVDEAAKVLQHAQQFANKTGDTATLAFVALGTAIVECASGKKLEAASLLRKTLAETKDRIPVSIQLEVRLTLAELEMSLKAPSAGRTQLLSLEQDAKAKGFFLVAHKAIAALKIHGLIANSKPAS